MTHLVNTAYALTTFDLSTSGVSGTVDAMSSSGRSVIESPPSMTTSAQA